MTELRHHPPLGVVQPCSSFWFVTRRPSQPTPVEAEPTVAQVLIKGSGLQPLYESLRDHRATVIEEHADSVFDAPADAPAKQTRISQITIEQAAPA